VGWEIEVLPVWGSDELLPGLRLAVRGRAEEVEQMVLELQRRYPRARISRRDVPTVEQFRRLYPWLFDEELEQAASHARSA
jgi:hypothetical protein